MTSIARVQARPGQRALLITTLAVPLTGWTVHAVALHRQLAHAQRDKLTGALRRESFEPRVQRFINRHRDQAMVLVCDVDHFKRFNDQFGHAMGDRVLAVTAARISQWAGSRGIVGRLGGDGGDEFLVAAHVPAARRASLLQQLMQALSAPITTDDGRLVDVGVSVGAATPDAIGTRDRSTLMRAADVAMFKGKHGGVAVQAGPEHANAASVNGRRAGRIGTHAPARAA
ncbi:GGDEF domain-containing protein [Streptomyces sp. G-G2]|uniref:GGDEF domain-containing protein n=1 Tax=Streptomyces sp. G-G2 TaxID=3046201 RepID=UPI0024B9B918|nr:GGDEF domain-containing protein [Streptomyces sp. G-G2]MDJ0384985.1 GGDEF domain-containing protein [Streptomyces sp. G-G2]